jgi:putative component of membrane protein insertase Oxa1/YidC/SpoIIIJ protein YidD
MRTIVVFLIGLYQRYLSPYKGFRCAHAVRHRGASCSAAVKDIVIAHGLLRGLPLIRLRFAQCPAAALALRVHNPDPQDDEERRKRRRRNSDDDSCACEAAGEACNGANCPDFGACHTPGGADSCDCSNVGDCHHSLLSRPWSGRRRLGGN